LQTALLLLALLLLLLVFLLLLLLLLLLMLVSAVVHLALLHHWTAVLQVAAMLQGLAVVHHALLPRLHLHEAAAVRSLHGHLLVSMLHVLVVLLCFQSAACPMQQGPWRSCQLHPWEARQTQSCVPSSQ
jgi:hypothetical protein